MFPLAQLNEHGQLQTLAGYLIVTLTVVDPTPEEGLTVTVDPGSGSAGIVAVHARLDGAFTETDPENSVKVPVLGGGLSVQLTVAFIVAGDRVSVLGVVEGLTRFPTSSITFLSHSI